MSTINLYLVVVLIALGVALVIMLNWLVTAITPRLYASTEHLLGRLPVAWQRRLESSAQQASANNETPRFILEQSAMMLALVVSILLPLPGGVTGLVCGCVLVVLMRRRLHQRLWVKRFEQQWPNCLDMLAMLMRAGLSFSAALHSLARLPSSSIAVRQLRQLHQQLHAGVPIESAFSAMKTRMPSAAFAAFTAAVLQARMSGSALTETLMLQAEQVRQEQQLSAEKFAQEVGVKLLFPLVTCFFPVTFILILAPIFIGYL